MFDRIPGTIASNFPITSFANLFCISAPLALVTDDDGLVTALISKHTMIQTKFTYF